MKFSVTCDDSNNSYADELTERVRIHFKFEGVKSVYELVLKPQEGQDFEGFKKRCFESAATAFQEADGRELANDLVRMVSQGDRKAKRSKK